jgi:AcrR family transcriptional regulator
MNNAAPAPAPSRHERRRRQTRQRLIETTLQLVLARGYDHFTIQDITDQADLGRGTFYLHFKDKEEVVWSAFQEMFETLEQAAHQTLAPTQPHAEYYGLLNIFRHADTNRGLYQVMLGGQGAAALAARMQDYLARAILYDIQQAPRPAGATGVPIPDEIKAQLLTGMLTRLLAWWLQTPNAYPPEAMAAMAYAAVYRKKPPAAPKQKSAPSRS